MCDLAEEATNTKRFTYVFGDEKAFYKTPIQRFNVLQKNASSFQAIKNAFSVEALSDDFFEEYRKQYADFVKFLTGKKYVKKGNKWVEEEEGTPDPQFFSSFGGDEKMVRDYVKKMMGRIVFLYFLQSKGWLAGNYHYMHDLFTGSEQKDDFLDKVLEPMFFGLLNTKPEDRRTAPLVNGVGVKYIPNADQIPYLNGGLFQQEKIDEVDSRFPAKMFQSLFDFFDSYNFTIDENDPNDAEVGVDPEMLGKIFENLLEDNKDKGAFYTPKEIVRYMCQESLIAYLQTHESDEAVKQHIANFVKTYNVEELGGAFSELAASIDQRLKDVKICDPAIGSGAFPMGLLRELYACRKAIEIFDADNAADIKRHIIQNNIYGVDIEKGAVDIARLRFWLALIIDEKEPMPLPNLDFKIMQGNSLLESYKGVDLSQVQKKVRVSNSKKNRGVLSLSFDEQDDMANIQRLVKQYFDITDHVRRDECRNQINHYIKDYIKKCGPAIAEEVDDLEIPNDQFFLWHTYFADVFENGGFDIVIGNPPYGATLEEDDKKVYRQVFPEVQFKINTYTLFVLFANKLLNNKGVMYYIIPNTLLDNYFEELVRVKLLEECMLLEINDLSDHVFESAVVHSMIFGIRKVKCSNDYSVKINISDKLFGENISIPASFFNAEPQHTFSIRSYSNNALYRKLNENSLPLSDVLDIRQAIKSGNDKEYIVDYKVDGNYKPILRGKDVKRYVYTNPNLYLNYGKHLACPRDYRIFEQPKILIREAGSTITATYDESGFYIMSSLYNAILIDKSFSLKYLLALLCSRLYQYLMNKLTFEKTKGAFTKAKIFHYYNLPVKNISLEMQDTFIHLVDRILLFKQTDKSCDTSALENKIDFLVYHIYDLTYDEVLIVDPNPPFTREEYEAYQVEQ